MSLVLNDKERANLLRWWWRRSKFIIERALLASSKAAISLRFQILSGYYIQQDWRASSAKFTTSRWLSFSILSGRWSEEFRWKFWEHLSHIASDIMLHLFMVYPDYLTADKSIDAGALPFLNPIPISSGEEFEVHKKSITWVWNMALEIVVYDPQVHYRIQA